MRRLEQFDRVSSEDRFLVGIAQERGVEHEIDAYGPVERIVRPINHVTDADFSDQMSQTLLAENHCVYVELFPEYSLGFFFSALQSAPLPRPHNASDLPL